MAEGRPVNIATITEEKVEEEEVGEDGMVETISSSPEMHQPTTGESTTSTTTDEGDDALGPSLDRPSSLVEKDGEDQEEEAGRGALSSILSSITFDSPSSSSSSSSSSSIMTLPRTTLPRPHPAAHRSGSRSMTLPRAGSRASGFTMSLSEKFVTELSFYDPEGSALPLGSPVILLGVFLATDQVLGDHSVYKVSPVSPLAALKIRPQDRLLKINGISLEGWSHACLVDYVKSLTLSAAAAVSATTINDISDTPTDIMLSMELRRVGRSIRSPHEAPPSRVVDATLRIRRRRATVTAVQERETCVRYHNTLPRRLKAAQKDLHLATSLSLSGVASVVVEPNQHSGAGRFLLHTFDGSSVSPSSSALCSGVGGGEVVMAVVESDDQRSWFLSTASPTGIGLMYSAGLEPQTLTKKDVRFFSLIPASGDNLFRVQSLATGSFLSVTQNSLGLVARNMDGTLPDSTLIQIVPYY